MATGYSRQSASGIVDGQTITASLFNNEFNAILNAFHASTGHTHDGTAGGGAGITALVSNTLTFGTGIDADVVITFNGNNNDGVFSWMEDEDYFKFSDGVRIEDDLTVTGDLTLSGNHPAGGDNLAVGQNTFQSVLADAYNNAAFGDNALSVLTSGSDNTCIGADAGLALTTGNNNTFIGCRTGKTTTTQSNNVYVGEDAGKVATAAQNTYVGQGSGILMTTGNDNTILGRYTGNEDDLDMRTLSNRIVLSDGGGNIGLYIDDTQAAHFDNNIIAYSTTISDKRLKSNITKISKALDKVGKINGVTFVRDNTGEKAAGIIAQEVMEVLPEAIKTQALPLQTGDHDKEYYAVEYDAVTGLLVEAVKELKERVEALESK